MKTESKHIMTANSVPTQSSKHVCCTWRQSAGRDHELYKYRNEKVAGEEPSINLKHCSCTVDMLGGAGKACQVLCYTGGSAMKRLTPDLSMWTCFPLLNIMPTLSFLERKSEGPNQYFIIRDWDSVHACSNATHLVIILTGEKMSCLVRKQCMRWMPDRSPFPHCYSILLIGMLRIPSLNNSHIDLCCQCQL